MTEEELIRNIQREAYKRKVPAGILRAIPKSELVIGRLYHGQCRNADNAIWKGDRFEYERYKWGSRYTEKINHYEDDDGYDVFVPIEINNE